MIFFALKSLQSKSLATDLVFPNWVAFRGGSRIFSRWGGGIFSKKKLENFDDFFFRRRQMFEKKTVKKAVFGHLLKNFGKKIAFFSARAPPPSYYILAPKAPLEKF